MNTNPCPGKLSDPSANVPNLPDPITTLFVDIGGVLLTNGWDRHARRRAAAKFKLDFVEMDARHRTVFTSYEEGKVTLDEYLDLTVFHEQRAFSRDDVRKFIFSQSKPHPDMIVLIEQLRGRHRLKVLAVNNEARELNAYRIAKFKLGDFVDAFISSCFVRIRKPDVGIFRLALDISQAPPEQVLYLDDTPVFAKVAKGLGIRSIVHTDYLSTCRQLTSLGLLNEGSP